MKAALQRVTENCNNKYTTITFNNNNHRDRDHHHYHHNFNIQAPSKQRGIIKEITENTERQFSPQ